MLGCFRIFPTFYWSSWTS